MIRTLVCLALLTAVPSLAFAQDAAADPAHKQLDPYPTPSRYPVAWEFDFIHSMPKRVLVNIPGQINPEAYWYMTYQVTNNTDQERIFLPVFEMVTEDGQVIRSDKNIPATVFNAIKDREKNRFLEPAAQVAGELRLGDDQAREGVAIWKEPASGMGQFTIFVTGLSGESARTTIGDKEFILRKTLQLDYQVRGDRTHPGQDEIIPLHEQWVMR